MKFKYIYPIFALLLFSCKLDKVENPNSADPNDLKNNPTIEAMNSLVSGIEASSRNQHFVYCHASGTVARECYLFNSDPRNTGDLLGKDNTTIDNNSFYLTGPYNARYICIKTANILLDIVDNSADATDVEKSGYKGFANTMKAHELLMVLNMLGKNGIRVDVADENNLGPFVGQDEALGEIAELLDLGYKQINDGEISWTLSSGFQDGTYHFDSKEGFVAFNRALAARVAAYREKWDDVLTHLNNSFFDINAELGFGPRHIFSSAAKDILNGFYKVPGQTGDMIFAHANYGKGGDYYESDEDARLNKFFRRETPVLTDGLEGLLETRLYPSADAPMDIIRNEELIFLYAEAQLQKGNTPEFLTAINRIRTYYGLEEYSGLEDKDSLIEEFLNQKRYSFWGEGHMLVDYRRYGKLNDDYLPIDRTGDDVFVEFPIPLTEAQ